jgi:protein CLEC16A
MLASLFGARRDRFTLANIRRLTDVLRVTPASGFSRHTASQVVETFREIAELMIYGDQHDPSFFDAFIEQRVMAHFTKFISPPGGGRPDRDIALQLLQTLAIVVQNIREETSLFFLFSEGHVPKRLVEANLDFDDEEVLGRYVSLLKTTSMRLNARTVQMFFFTGTETREGGKAAGEQSDAVAAAFPLFAAGARFLSHHESMVRAASRTITLNCLAVTDARVRQFLCSPKPWGKCVPRAVEAAGATVAALTEATLFAEPDAPGARERANLVAELGDLLSFVDDATGLPEANGESLAERVETELWNGLVAPTLLGSVAPGRFVSAPRDASARGVARDSHATQSDSRDPRRDAGPPQTSPTTALFAVSRLAVSCRRRSTLVRVAADLFGFESNGAAEPGARRVANARRAFLVRALAGAEGAPVAAAATAAAVSLAQAATDQPTSALAAALREVGLAAVPENETGTETETESASRARAEMCDALAAGLARDDPGLPVGARRCSAWLLSRLAGGRDGLSEPARASLAAAAASAAASMRRAVDGPWGDAAASAFAAEWRTTRREISRPTLRDETAASWIREAAASTSGSARREANDGDGDDDANATRQTRHEADTPSTSAPVIRVREESASAAGKLLRASRELALAAMLLDATRGAPGMRPAFPSEPPARLFGDPADVERAAFPPDSGFAFLEVPPISRSSSAAGDERWAEIREGVEFGGRAATERRFACRVAFEAGRERAVSLVLAVRKCENAATEERPPGLAAAALLLEALPGANDADDRSVVRAVAPLGACDAFADPAHAKWLRVRVRSPLSCLASASSLASAGGSCSTSPEVELKRLRKKLRDGHWTLAFADEAACAAARDAIDAGAAAARAACRAALAPVLSELS